MLSVVLGGSDAGAAADDADDDDDADDVDDDDDLHLCTAHR